MAAAGYRVVGADVSAAMMRVGMSRAAHLPIAWHQADVVRLPYAGGSFDLAVATHLFYFIRDWRQAARELLRVVEPGGAILLMHTGSGAEMPAFNARYKALCAQAGYPIPRIGVESTRDVVDYYAKHGCAIEWWRDRWAWTEHIRLDAALRHIQARAYSFTTFAPDDVHKAVVDQMRGELLEEFGTLEDVITVPNQIYIAVISR